MGNRASSDKKVDEILVQEGDEVKAGDKLFTYNTEEMEENLAQAEIDLDRLANEIDQTKEQIVSLKKRKQMHLQIPSSATRRRLIRRKMK